VTLARTSFNGASASIIFNASSTPWPDSIGEGTGEAGDTRSGRGAGLLCAMIGRLSDNESSIAQILQSFPSLLESAFPKLLERVK
jgi:hypothetical protein